MYSDESSVPKQRPLLGNKNGESMRTTGTSNCRPSSVEVEDATASLAKLHLCVEKPPRSGNAMQRCSLKEELKSRRDVFASSVWGEGCNRAPGSKITVISGGRKIQGRLLEANEGSDRTVKG